MSGQRLSLAGRQLRMARASTVVLVGERLGEGGQGVVHEAAMGSVPCVVKWYRSNPPADLRRAIARLAERERPHPAFIWPIDLVVSDEMPGFGYVMPRLEPGFGSFAQLLARPEQPPFRVIITIGRQLVSAFEALHASGLCYRDINFGNLLVDPERSRVAIIASRVSFLPVHAWPSLRRDGDRRDLLLGGCRPSVGEPSGHAALRPGARLRLRQPRPLQPAAVRRPDAHLAADLPSLLPCLVRAGVHGRAFPGTGGCLRVARCGAALAVYQRDFVTLV